MGRVLASASDDLELLTFALSYPRLQFFQSLINMKPMQINDPIATVLGVVSGENVFGGTRLCLHCPLAQLWCLVRIILSRVTLITLGMLARFLFDAFGFELAFSCTFNKVNVPCLKRSTDSLRIWSYVHSAALVSSLSPRQSAVVVTAGGADNAMFLVRDIFARCWLMSRSFLSVKAQINFVASLTLPLLMRKYSSKRVSGSSGKRRDIFWILSRWPRLVLLIHWPPRVRAWGTWWMGPFGFSSGNSSSWFSPFDFFRCLIWLLARRRVVSFNSSCSCISRAISWSASSCAILASSSVSVSIVMHHQSNICFASSPGIVA